jgi:hypothetical protein
MVFFYIISVFFIEFTFFLASSSSVFMSNCVFSVINPEITRANPFYYQYLSNSTLENCLLLPVLYFSKKIFFLFIRCFL